MPNDERPGLTNPPSDDSSPVVNDERPAGGAPSDHAPKLDKVTGAANARYVVTSDRGTLRYLSSSEVSNDASNIPGVRDSPVQYASTPGASTSRRSSTSGRSSTSSRSKRRRRQSSGAIVWLGGLALAAIAILLITMTLL